MEKLYTFPDMEMMLETVQQPENRRWVMKRETGEHVYRFDF